MFSRIVTTGTLGLLVLLLRWWLLHRGYMRRRGSSTAVICAWMHLGWVAVYDVGMGTWVHQRMGRRRHKMRWKLVQWERLGRTRRGRKRFLLCFR
jgi:hypothetical protein